jgi:hypothetical protein
MSFPIPDAWNEVPSPRLMADLPVSVSGIDFAPVTVAPTTKELTVVAGEKLTVPLSLVRRSEFSGATLQMRTMGAVFERNPQFDVKLAEDTAQVVLDTATLKPAPGDYLVSFYGGAVAKYRHHPEAVTAAEEAKKKAELEQAAADAELKKLTEDAKAAAAENKSDADKAVEAATARQKQAAAAVAAATEHLKRATATAAPQDIVDIVVSEPITVRVLPAEKK